LRERDENESPGSGIIFCEGGSRCAVCAEKVVAGRRKLKISANRATRVSTHKHTKFEKVVEVVLFSRGGKIGTHGESMRSIFCETKGRWDGDDSFLFLYSIFLLRTGEEKITCSKRGVRNGGSADVQ
jgi:hypothetical protein